MKLTTSDPWVFEVGQVVSLYGTPGFFWVKSVRGREVELARSYLGRYWFLFRVWLNGWTDPGPPLSR